MRIAAISSPRKVATIPKLLTLHIRVLSGAVLLAREQQTLLSGGGLTVTSEDGILSLEWDAGELWIMGSDTGLLEVILPT